MRWKRIAALLLCAALLAGLCAGCGTSSLADVVARYNDPSGAVYDYTKALKTYDADEVMGTVNGLEVTWDELFYWIRHYVDAFSSAGSDEDSDSSADADSDSENTTVALDWDAEVTEGTTYRDAILTLAFKKVVYAKVIESKAAEIGAELSEDDLQKIEATWGQVVASYGSEDAANAALIYSSLNYDLYMDQLAVDYLYKECYRTLYGENGEKLDEAEILDHVADANYMMVKQIYICNTDKNGVKLEQSDLDELYAKMEEAKEKLDAYTGDDIEAYFDELMDEYSEDDNREGYVFQETFMLSEVAEAAKGLAEYEYSDILDSAQGYHIILRLPVNPDLEPNTYFTPVGEGYTMRRTVADELFEETVSEWLDSAEVQTTDTFKAIDFHELFPEK